MRKSCGVDAVPPGKSTADCKGELPMKRIIPMTHPPDVLVRELARRARIDHVVNASTSVRTLNVSRSSLEC